MWIGGSESELGGGGPVATDQLVVARWSRYGQIRLYVSTPDGAQVGWVDPVSGERSLTMPELATAFEAAIADAEPDLPQPPGTNPPDAYVPRRALADPAPAPAPAPAPSAAREQRVAGDHGQTVGARLDKLRSHGWFLLHSVPLGTRGTTIDHLLIGPGGVHTLTTRTHPKASIWVGRTTVLVDGRSQPYLRNARFEADRARTLLTAAIGSPVDVTPALVFLTDTFLPQVTVRDQPDGVVILDRLDLPRYFRKRAPLLGPDQVELIFEHARRPSTWT